MSKSITLAQEETMPLWRCYLALTKPKVVALMLLTALVGMCLSNPDTFLVEKALLGLFGIGLMAGAAASLNHLIDERIDGIMERTHKRPLPSGRLKANHVIVFATILGLTGFITLFIGVNQLTAWLTFASLVGYALVYTMYLKRATPQNIVIAGIAGAMPPLLGWTALTNELHPHAWILVMIIFVWTPPHFWALSIHRYQDYAKAKIPMLPVTHGIEYTKTSILLYTILLAVVSMLPFLIGMSGSLYLFGSTLLSVGFIYHAYKLKYLPTDRSAIEAFKFSIYHLMLLFLFLLFDNFFVI